MTRKKPEELRSHRWFGVEDMRAFGHRSRMLQMGYDYQDFAGKPVIGILNTWSDLNPCHAHLRTRAEEVKRGVWQGGGFPVEIPAISLGETMMKPTTMLYRNLLAMEAEELLRSNPRRRRSLARGLRQDDARPDHGCDQHEHSGDLFSRRTDAAWQFWWQAARLGIRCLEILGGERSRPHRRARMARDGSRYRAKLRHLHDDGHGLDHGRSRRDARPDLAWRRLDACRRFRSHQAGDGKRPAHRRHGARGPDAEAYPHRGLVPQRDHRVDGHERLDQRNHPSDRDGAACRIGARLARFRPPVERDGSHCRYPAVGPLPHGGFSLCRRLPRLLAPPHAASEAR